jgi:hypothetical protein
MSEYVNELKAVQQEIKDLLKKKTRLKKKERKGQLDDDEEIELEGLAEELATLERREKFWQVQVDKENKADDKPESKTFGEADKKWIESVCEVDCRYRKWTGYVLDETIVPSERFKANFIETQQVFHQVNEAGRRVFLNLFLSDIVGSAPFLNNLRVFTEIPMEVLSTNVAENGKKRRLNGKFDYTIGFAGDDVEIFDIAPPNELHLVALEAKCGSSLSDFWQCVAEAATLYKSRKDKRKTKLCVWGVLSNAKNWEFIHIDQGGDLYRSAQFNLDLQIMKRKKFYLSTECFTLL